MVDEIYHPDYKAVSNITGIKVDLEAGKEAYLAFIEHLIVAPVKIFYVFKDTASTEKQIFLYQEQLLSLTKMRE